MPNYIRDKRSPKPKNELVSKVMSANKSKGTKPELLFRKALWAIGLRGYRCNYKKVPGRPDVAFPKKRIAIFINGCFWHRCPYCELSIPKTNKDFWEAKFDANKRRDKMKIKKLQKLGWKVFVIWECKINDNLKQLIEEKLVLLR